MAINGNPDSARYFGELSRRGYEAAGEKNNARRAEDLIKAADILKTLQTENAANTAGIERYNQLLAMGRQYQSGAPHYDVNRLNISANYLHSAIQLAETAQNDSMRIAAWKEMAKTRAFLNNVPESKYFIELVAAKFLQQRNNLQLARTWHFYGDNVRRQKARFYLILDAYNKARQYYVAAGDLAGELNTGLEESTFLQLDSRQEEATALLQSLIRKYPDPLPYSYRLRQQFAQMAQRRGDLSTALREALTGYRQAEQHTKT